MKKAQMRRQLTVRGARGLSGLYMLDHIKWTGGPPSIEFLDTAGAAAVSCERFASGDSAGAEAP
jgi:hypothetical protein